jgi:hypothetical protein
LGFSKFVADSLKLHLISKEKGMKKRKVCRQQHQRKNKKDPQKKPDLTPLKTSWGAPYVERQKVSEFSGGILHPRTMSNLDARDEGPPGRFRIGKKIAYPVDSLISWMEARAEYPCSGPSDLIEGVNNEI